MKIEIKNVKHSELASEETHCFKATVYIDGTRAFIASNDGKGAGNDYYPANEKTISYWEVWAATKEINKELDKIDTDLDIEVFKLVTNYLIEKDLRRALKKICYINDGQLYTVAAKHKPTEKNIEAIKKAGWWKSSFVMLNSMPFYKAFDEYLEVCQ